VGDMIDTTGWNWASTIDSGGNEHTESPEISEPLFVDIAAILAKGIPPPPAPVLLRRTDGHALFYAAKVNVLFGDPECGKTWIAWRPSSRHSTLGGAARSSTWTTTAPARSSVAC
jgi:hypothetical protein